MSWQNNKKKKANSNYKSKEKIDASKTVSIQSEENKSPENVQFKALTDITPSLTSAVASADGKSIALLFNVSPAPILPAVSPKYFDVKFDGVSVPIVSINRDFVNFKTDCLVATTSSLTATYNNGTFGVGATLTGGQQVLIIDGVTLSLNDRVLVKSYTGVSNAPKNGVYRLSTVGVASTTNWVLTRVTDADTAAELSGMSVYVTGGSASNIGAWYLTTTGTITVGSTQLGFSKASSNAGKIYNIALSSPVKPNITVTLDYYLGGTDFVTNNKVSPDSMIAFTNFTVDTSNVQYPYGLFDPKIWASNNFPGRVPNGVVYERRVGFLTPPVVYDTVGPIGDIVLHQDKTKTLNGLFVHYFGCYNTNNDTETSTNLLPGTRFIQDVFGNTVREASTLGGATDPSVYETIGDGYVYYLVHYLNTNLTVKSIEFGLTASNPKNYVIEVKKTVSSSWTPIIYMYASNGTLEYFRYVFKTALTLYAVRIRYRGDYYYQSNTGLATVSSIDTLSGTEAVRLSHFSDFRDAQEFSVSNFPTTERLDPQDEGWIAFIDGTSFYDWDFINKNRVWNQFTTVSQVDSGTNLFNFKDRLIAVVGGYIYSIDADGVADIVYNASSTTVNAFAIYKNTLYIGLENGNILVSTTGLTFTSPPILSGLPPVKSLISFGNILWIGTSLDIDGNGYLYKYNGTSISRRSFGEYQVLSLGKTSKYMFIGLGSSVSGSKKGLIWYTNGITYTPIYNTLQDRVDVIEYNTGTSELWAGTSDGSIYSFSFKTDGSVNSISRIKQLGATSNFKFIRFLDSADSNYFWLVSNKLDGGVLVYNVDYNIYYEAFKPGSITINDIAYLNGSVYGIGSDGILYLVDINLFTSDEKLIYLQVRDLAGNVNTTTFTDNIIYGLPASTSTNTETPSGKIYQIKIPTTYVRQPTTTSDNLTYTTVRKWTSDDAIFVYANDDTIVTTESYTNLNNGSIIFASPQTDDYYITIVSPADELLKLVTTYDSPSKTSPIFAPTKTTRESGIYESEPYYAPSLNRWNEISTQSHFASTSPPVDGAESGLSIEIYVRAADTREECLLQDWGLPFTYSTINTTSSTGLINNTYSIQSYRGKWLQFKAVLSSASINVSPKLNFVAVSYFSANDTYFFTKRFDTASEYLDQPYAEIRRGLLTYNGSTNGGKIQFKYLASSELNDSFEIAKYTDITPNSIFELSTPSRYIRFAIMIVSAGDIAHPETAAIVDEFAVQLESGDKDLYWMNPDVP